MEKYVYNVILQVFVLLCQSRVELSEFTGIGSLFLHIRNLLVDNCQSRLKVTHHKRIEELKLWVLDLRKTFAQIAKTVGESLPGCSVELRGVVDQNLTQSLA